MRQFQTTVLDFKYVYQGDFQSAPFEAAWASEAIYFLRIEEIEGSEAALRATVQISVDGIHWIDEGTTAGPFTAPGDHFMRVKHFGGFLRLSCSLAGEGARVQMTNNLVLKE
jgi:hypothetical protein